MYIIYLHGVMKMFLEDVTLSSSSKMPGIFKGAAQVKIVHYTSGNFNPCSPEGFSQAYFPKGGGLLQPPLWIINTEGHITLNLLPMYRYGHPLSIDTKISTNH